jgi:SAM-dependent methyltransferase
MPNQVDLYNSAYAQLDHELYRQIRTETYGHDLGQTSWVTNEESQSIPRLLYLAPNSTVLELGCGSGLYALHLARTIGCRVTGIDLNPHGIATATQLATTAGLGALVRFQQCDAGQPLPFPDSHFDAAFANDVLCHIPGRPGLLQELLRVLKPSARLLFSDALLIGGIVSNLDLATRSSIGLYFFSPAGENERLLASAGFALVKVTDTSEQAAQIAQRWNAARERRREPLLALEGQDRFDGLQRFLNCVHQLTAERRLLRHLYLAEKPPAD